MKPARDWQTWNEAQGLPRPEVRQALARAQIFERLSAYRPVLAGTFPLGLEVENSDLDVLCEAADLDDFLAETLRLFGDRPGFEVERKLKQGIPSQLVRFRIEGYQLELFAQPIPVSSQRAFRHLDLEWRLLELCGERLRTCVLEMKVKGIKTEPAFAHALELSGDPYEAMDELVEVENLDNIARKFIAEKASEC